MDEKDFVTAKFLEEHTKRMEEEHRRQNHRIDNLEKAVEENRNLALSIERLTISVQAMVKEQQSQGERLEAQGERLGALESRDGEMWRKVVGYAITATIGVVVGYIFKQIGM